MKENKYKNNSRVQNTLLGYWDIRVLTDQIKLIYIKA